MMANRGKSKLADDHHRNSSLRSLQRSVKERMKLDILPIKHLLLVVFLHCTAMYMTIPAVIDVTMAALCPSPFGACNHAIYITGLQQVVTGVGTMILTPIFGGISDHYGRKPLFLGIFIISISPYAVLSYSRTKEFVYAFYVVDTIASTIVHGSVHCLTLAYVADTVEENARSSAFGILAGVVSLGYVTSMLAARAISESYIFQAAAAIAIVSILYIKVFLVETVCLELHGDRSNAMRHSPELPNFRKSRETWLVYITDSFDKVHSSPVLVQVIIITFLCSLADAGLQGVLWYYLKSVFNYGKNEFSELMLIGGSASVLIQLFVMPILVPITGEKPLLCLALFGDFINVIIYAIAWDPKVPYFCASAASLSTVIYSSISGMVSREATQDEQGKVQGIVSGFRSLATIISPLAMTPLTALFLSDHAPFPCRGFSILCMAFALLIATIQGCYLKNPAPPLHRGSKYIQVGASENALCVEAPMLLV